MRGSWLMSTDTVFGNAAVNGQPVLYDPSKSDSSQEVVGATWKSMYCSSPLPYPSPPLPFLQNCLREETTYQAVADDGSENSGKVYLDTVRIGLLTDNNRFSISNATIQSVVTVSNRFASDPKLSGVLGLAKSRPSQVQPHMPAMMDRLRPELHYEWIGIDLRSNSDKGYFSFGYAMGSATVNEAPIADDEHWSFQLAGLRMSSMSDKVWYRLNTRVVATIDTGSSLLLLPSKLVAKYYSEIPESAHDPALQAYVFPCSVASGIPDFTFQTAGGYVGNIPKEFINFGPVPRNSEKCFGGIQASASGDRAIFGGVALKNMYVQLNYGEQGSYVSFGNKGSLDVCSTTSACDK